MMANAQKSLTGQISRRKFTAVVGGLATVGLTTLSPRLAFAADSSERWAMHLAASTSVFGTLSLDEACRRIAALGFEAVDIWHAKFHSPHLEEIETKLGAAGLQELLTKHKLKLCAFTAYLTQFSRIAKLMGELGGGLVIRGSAALKPNESMSAQMKRFMKNLQPEIDLAEKYNCHLAVENHANKSLLNSLDSFKAFADLNTHARVGIALAPYHLQWEKVPIDEVFATAGKQVRFFYAWQYAKGLDGLPGIGPTDFTPWLAMLAKANYQGYVDPFTHFHVGPDEMEQALAKSRDYLKKCYQSLEAK